MLAITILIGFLLLILGRPFYSVFVGSYGFIAGIYLATFVYPIRLVTDVLWVSLVIALLFGLLTFQFKRLSALIAGIAAGAFLVDTFPAVMGWNTSWISWQVFVIAGLASALLIRARFDFSLILLSSFTGVSLIAKSIHITQISTPLLAVLLLVFGIAVQVVLLGYGRPNPD